MPRNWVVSCHGSATLQQGQTNYMRVVEMVPLKPGITFMQFGSEADPFPNDRGWQAYFALMKSPPDFGAARNMTGCKEFKGQSLPNYKMSGGGWVDSKNNLLASGIFVAGDTFHKDPMTVYLRPGGQTLSLKQFFSDPEVKSGDVVWWLACRSWLKSGFPVNFPSEPAPLPVLPSNLRAPTTHPARQRANAVSRPKKT
jgi:hypothetical protein